MAQIQIVIVTPEETTFDQMVDGVVLPLIDGEAGVLPGHAPMIGRLGPGELRVRSGSDESRFYVDGGFVQVERNVVSVLTGNSLPAAELDITVAKNALAKAENEPSDTLALSEIKRKAVAQAKAQIRMIEKS
jgi:F-type H+-transporting ATPase subunit epsilon